MEEIIINNLPLIILGLLSLVEIVPIKISPLEWLGKKMNKQINDKIDVLESKIDSNHQKQCKILISNFVQDYLNGENKTKSQWVAIMTLANEYIEKGWNSEIKADAIFLGKEYNKLFLEGKKKNEKN